MRAIATLLVLLAVLVMGACGDDNTPKVADAAADGCRPRTCGELGAACGAVDDGCGRQIMCPCSCDGGACCASTQTCEQLGAACGVTIDSCGKRLACGSCGAGQTCGAAGPNHCGSGQCTAAMCSRGQCGQISNGCDGVLDCGVCPSGQECISNQCQACATADCIQQTSCTPATYLADCPQRPCQEVAGCQGSMCTYRDFECADSASCPFETCQSSPYIESSRTYYRNQCVRQDNHECSKQQPGGAEIRGTCRGNSCVSAQELQLVEGHIEPLADPGRANEPMRRLLDESLFFGPPTVSAGTEPGRVCDPSANRCLIGGFTTEGT